MWSQAAGVTLPFALARTLRETSLPTPIITDGTTDRVRQFPRVVLPDPSSVFYERAQRLDALASGHSMGEYLRSLALIARAQQAACSAREAQPLGTGQLTASREYGMPPLSAQAHERSATWREDLADIVGRMRPAPFNGIEQALAAVSGADDAELESLADRVLAGTTLDTDAAVVPFVGAALQVYFTRLAAGLEAEVVSHCDVATICPVCGTRPVASVVCIGAERANLRYLSCALCASEWHMARVQCSSCASDKGLHYLSIEVEGRSPERSAARAETCDECRSYLKIFYREADAGIEPAADDLATLALDLMVDERGYLRSGPNLLLHPGST